MPIIYLVRIRKHPLISLDGVLFESIRRSVSESQRKKEIWACGLARAVTYLSSVISSRIDNVTRRVLFILGRGEWKYGAVQMGNCHTYSLLIAFQTCLRKMPCPLHVWSLVQLDLSSQLYFMFPSFWWSWENCEFSWFCETGNVDR